MPNVGHFVVYKLYFNKELILRKAASQLCSKILVQDKEAGGPERIQLWEKDHDPDVLFRETKENVIL